MTKLMGPIMGKGMLWAREKKKEEPLKSSDGPAKSSAEVVNKFVGNDPDDGDEIRGMARVNRLFLEIRTMVRKHQVEEKNNKFTRFSFPPKLGLKTIVSDGLQLLTWKYIFGNAQKSRKHNIQDVKIMKSLFPFVSTR